MSLVEEFLNGRVSLHCGDCREVLATLPENSLDACVTDPPYCLTSIVKRFGADDAAPAKSNGATGVYARASGGFMNKRWDNDIAFRPETWAAVYRVLKPGAHLIAFGGDRTFHRLACAIEDAGFEIRGTIAYIFGSGFPKNLDVSKRMRGCFSADALRACDHCCWQIVQDYPSDYSSDPDLDGAQLRSAKGSVQDGAPSRGDVHAHNRGDQRADDQEQEQASIFLDESTGRPSNEDCVRQSVARENYQFDDNAQLDIPLSMSSDGLKAAHRSRARKSGISHSDDGSDASTQHANLPQCQTCGKRGIPDGLGTSLKPAMELLCLARKPLSESTVAANCLRWGTGAINVDGCRVEVDELDQAMLAAAVKRMTGNAPNAGAFQSSKAIMPKVASGRWPANVVHDGSDEVLAAFPDAGGGYGGNTGKPNNVYGDYGGLDGEQIGYGDSGSAARFFFQAKQDDPCRSINSASDAVENFALKSERVVSVLSRAVAITTERLALEPASYRAPDMNVSVQQFALIVASVTETIQNIERRFSLGLPLESITVRLGHAICVAIPNQIGTTTITVSLSTFDPSAEAVTFSIIEMSAEVGVPDFAKRFHYTSKADSDDRLGSHHPTVKPLDLMQWLVRLVTPRGGIVLDPFAGTGTTGEAAWREGMRAVLIEAEGEYQADIRRRMALALAGPDERQRESIKAKNLPRDDGPLFAARETWAQMWAKLFDFSQEPGA